VLEHAELGAQGRQLTLETPGVDALRAVLGRVLLEIARCCLRDCLAALRALHSWALIAGLGDRVASKLAAAEAALIEATAEAQSTPRATATARGTPTASHASVPVMVLPATEAAMAHPGEADMLRQRLAGYIDCLRVAARMIDAHAPKVLPPLLRGEEGVAPRRWRVG